MIQLNKNYLENEKYISDIIGLAKTELTKRQEDYKRFCKTTGVPIERYIATTGTSYFAGKTPTITVKKETDTKKISIIRKIFNKIVGNETDTLEYQTILDYINDYNDLPDFFYTIAKDYFVTGACYWISYETTENEIVYAPISSLQSVALYDYSTPVQLIGGLRMYNETDANGDNIEVWVLTLPNERRYYKNGRKTSNEFKEDTDMREDVNWQLTPFYAVENPDKLSLFDSVKGLIDKLEQVVTNESNIYQYNDDAKLFVPGYSPQESYLDEEGNINKNRVKEDEAVLNAPVFYDPQGTNKPEWIIKDINDTAIMNYKKTLVDYIFMLSMVPNMLDVSFTNTDSGKALRYKFYSLELIIIETEKQFKKELQRMYENITDRINTKKNTKYDFRDIQIEMNRNIPIDDEDVAQSWMGLRGLLSDTSIIEHLPYELDAQTEMQKIKDEESNNFETIYNKVSNVNNELDKEEN